MGNTVPTISFDYGGYLRFNRLVHKGVTTMIFLFFAEYPQMKYPTGNLRIHQFSALQTGPRLIVTGAVHDYVFLI